MLGHKAGWRYYFFLIFFGAASVLGCCVVGMLLRGEVMDGDQEMSRSMAVLLSVGLTLAFSTYIETTLVLLRQLVQFNGCGMQITPKGVEHTLVWVNVLCVVLVFPVRCIPWEAVKYTDFDDDPYIRVDVKKVDAGPMARLVLWVLGYNFLAGFVKPGVTASEIQRYAHRFSLEGK